MSRSVSGITKRNKRTIQEVERKRSKADRSPLDQSGNGDKPPRRKPPGERGSQKAATFGVWFVGIVAILFLFFLFSVVFAETTVTVYPKTAPISIDDTYTASLDDSEDAVGYSVVSAEEAVELSATSSGSEYREEVASGQITIYNDYSSQDIRLVPNTRFETEDGLIYRTRKVVVVPGQTSQGPGTVTATVYADEPGSEYNVSQADFSIPGFNGTAYEGSVYAESNTAIDGGVAREVPVVASSTRQILEEQAADQLQNQLRNQLKEELPDGFVIYDNGTFFTTSISSNGDETNVSNDTTLTVTGQLQAIAFDGGQLSSYLATDYSNDVSPEASVRIQNLEDFSFEIQNRDDFDLSSDNSFQFSLSGDSQIVWQYDERALVRDLRGLQKDRLNEVLDNYDSVQEAEVVTRPFWKRTLPSEASEITVNTVIR